MRLFTDAVSAVTDPFLSRALTLAEKGRGATAPNPMVGCVVVRDGGIVGEGFHPRAGEPHAEVFALRDAGDRARGADVYVSLEPCAHEGRTPPCVDALIAAGVARVHIGMPDPTPLAGGGAERLRGAGIEVTFAADPTPFAELNEAWLKRSATSMPFVRAKLALSLDGRPAFAEGARAAITGASGAAVSQRLRAASDAVLVGSATLAADDPALTVRSADGVPAARQPLRVVLARRSVPDPTARMFADGLGPVLVLLSDESDDAALESLAASAPGVQIARYRAAESLEGALRALGERGVTDLLIEPGPRLLTALWRSNVLDELVTVTAGGMAGPEAPGLFGGEPDLDPALPGALAQPRCSTVPALHHRMRPVEAGIVGDVSVTVWRPSGAGEM